MSRRILVIGGAGLLGSALAGQDWPDGWMITATTRRTLDLTDGDAIAATIAGTRWAAVINAAAYTAVDRAEREIEAAWAVNALGPAVLAAACARADIPLLHISSDYVFDGARDGAWQEDDPIAPRNVYGASKAAGELAVRTACPRHVILRTSWLIGAHGNNFLTTMLRLGAVRDTIRVVDDQHGGPTGVGDLAAVAARIAMALADDPAAPTGTYHFSNAGVTTWFGLAQAIFARTARSDRRPPALVPITTADYPAAARRPVNSRLDHGRIADAYGIVPRPWQEALDHILRVPA